MKILYEDKQIICDEEAITIKDYYAPLGGDKKIPYNQINSITEKNLSIWSGITQILGNLNDLIRGSSSTKSYWTPLNPKRLFKNKAIVIDDGELVKSVIIPEEQEKVLEILQIKAIISHE
jgi:hypothetical protein